MAFFIRVPNSVSPWGPAAHVVRRPENSAGFIRIVGDFLHILQDFKGSERSVESFVPLLLIYPMCEIVCLSGVSDSITWLNESFS